MLFRATPASYGGSQLGVESELQLLACTTATATQELSCVFDLHHSSRQHRILNPLSEARDRTCNLIVPRWIHFRCATTGTPVCRLLIVEWGREVLLASCGWRHLTGGGAAHHPAINWTASSQKMIQLQVSIVWRLRNRILA